MFVLLDNKYVSDSQLSKIVEKLSNPYNDLDNLFEVNSVQLGDYTLATNGTFYNSDNNLKMVCKSKSKSISVLYSELCEYSDFGNNIENIKDVVRKQNEPFCLVAVNNNGDYLVIGDKSGIEGLYSGYSNGHIVIYSTYHINTYFKNCVNVDKVMSVDTDSFILCLNGTTQTIKIVQDTKQISLAGQIGKGIMSGDLLNGGENNMSMDSIFGPLVSNRVEQMSSIEYETRPNKYGVSIFDRIVQWNNVQQLFDTVNIPSSTNVFYDKNFFKNYKSNDYQTVVKVVSEDWVDKALEMNSRGIKSVVLNMTDKSFPAVDIHLGTNGQEESIYRRSNISKALVLDKFYPFNNDNRVIYSSDVTIFYGGENKKWETLEDPQKMEFGTESQKEFQTMFFVRSVRACGWARVREWARACVRTRVGTVKMRPTRVHTYQKMSFISCPPIKSPYNLEYDYTKLFENSKLCTNHIAIVQGYLSNVLQAGIKNGHDGIVLPAFGCEGQKNPPRCIAEILKELIKQYSGFYKEIVVCIPEADNRLLGNFHIFQSILESDDMKIELETKDVQLDNILDELN
jgi:hypothetical protein